MRSGEETCTSKVLRTVNRTLGPMTRLLLLVLLLGGVARGEDSRLLDVDPFLLGHFVSTTFQVREHQGGRLEEKLQVKGRVAFGSHQNQSLALSVPYRFFQGAGAPAVESMGDVELNYIWLFDPDHELTQGVGLKLEMPTNGDAEAGGSWTLEPVYGFRWRPTDNLTWVNQLHYNRDLTFDKDYLEGTTSLSILLPDELYLNVGGKMRYLLTSDRWASALTAGVGKALDQETSLGLSIEQPLNTQGRSTYEVFKTELTLVRRL